MQLRARVVAACSSGTRQLFIRGHNSFLQQKLRQQHVASAAAGPGYSSILQPSCTVAAACCMLLQQVVYSSLQQQSAKASSCSRPAWCSSMLQHVCVGSSPCAQQGRSGVGVGVARTKFDQSRRPAPGIASPSAERQQSGCAQPLPSTIIISAPPRPPHSHRAGWGCSDFYDDAVMR